MVFEQFSPTQYSTLSMPRRLYSAGGVANTDSQNPQALANLGYMQ